MDLDDIIAQGGCAKLHAEVEQCYVDADRKWAPCQQQLRRFAECQRLYQEHRARTQGSLSSLSLSSSSSPPPSSSSSPSSSSKT